MVSRWWQRNRQRIGGPDKTSDASSGNVGIGVVQRQGAGIAQLQHGQHPAKLLVMEAMRKRAAVLACCCAGNVRPACRAAVDKRSPATTP